MLVHRTGQLAQRITFVIMKRYNNRHTTQHWVGEDRILFENSRAQLKDIEDIAVLPMYAKGNDALTYSHLSVNNCDHAMYLCHRLIDILLIKRGKANSWV